METERAGDYAQAYHVLFVDPTSDLYLPVSERKVSFTNLGKCVKQFTDWKFAPLAMFDDQRRPVILLNESKDAILNLQQVYAGWLLHLNRAGSDITLDKERIHPMSLLSEQIACAWINSICSGLDPENRLVCKALPLSFDATTNNQAGADLVLGTEDAFGVIDPFIFLDITMGHVRFNGVNSDFQIAVANIPLSNLPFFKSENRQSSIKTYLTKVRDLLALDSSYELNQEPFPFMSLEEVAQLRIELLRMLQSKVVSIHTSLVEGNLSRMKPETRLLITRKVNKLLSIIGSKNN